jgi:regulatory protein YycH of two-component signal transduction system YycFG
MKENIKSTILILLVISSLLLTYQLWYGHKPVELISDDSYERVETESPRSLEQVVTPEAIVVPFENGYYLYREGETEYYILWETLLSLLYKLDQEMITDNQDLNEGIPVILTCLLDPALPVGDELVALQDINGELVNRIELLKAGETFYLKFIGVDLQATLTARTSAAESDLLNNLLQVNSEADRTSYRQLTVETILAVLNREIEIETSIYIPLEDQFFPRLIVRPETIEREQVLKTFFVDYNLARAIEEKGGAVIYTDGERGLRLTAKGLEYSHPRLDEGQVNQTLQEAIYNCGSLISLHGGWPSGLRLESIALADTNRVTAYDAQWRMYHKGFPIYTAKPTRAVFNDRGLIHYSRSIYNIQAADPEEQETRKAADWPAALEAAFDIYDEGQDDPNSLMKLEAFNLGFAIMSGLNDLVAEPVWYIQIDGARMLLKADNLVQINWEDLQ